MSAKQSTEKEVRMTTLFDDQTKDRLINEAMGAFTAEQIYSMVLGKMDQKDLETLAKMQREPQTAETIGKFFARVGFFCGMRFTMDNLIDD